VFASPRRKVPILRAIRWLRPRCGRGPIRCSGHARIAVDPRVSSYQIRDAGECRGDGTEPVDVHHPERSTCSGRDQREDGPAATTVVEKGAPISRRNPDSGQRRHTTWELASSLPDEAEPAAHLEALLPLFEPRSSALRQIQGTGTIAFWSCVVTAKPTGNMLWFEPDFLCRLGEVGAALEFDIYDSDDG
jgi:uncharacterized protein DUF4279